MLFLALFAIKNSETTRQEYTVAKRQGITARRPWALQGTPVVNAILVGILGMPGCTPVQELAKRAPSLPPAAPERQVTPAPPPPIAARAIELAGYCSRTEDDGFREEARVRVTANEVQALNWKLWVPRRRGSCAFELSEFRQVQKAPHIELVARDDSGCKLMVWQDPRRVTLAHANCQKRCTPGIYEEAWPVMFDPASGMCAQVK